MFLYGNPQLGIQYSLVVPNSSPFNVWFEKSIVYFCRTLNEALGGVEDLIDAKANGELATLLKEEE